MKKKHLISLFLFQFHIFGIFANTNIETAGMDNFTLSDYLVMTWCPLEWYGTHLGQEQVCRRVGSWKSQWAEVASGAGLGGPGVRLMVESCQTRSGSTVEGGEAWTMLSGCCCGWPTTLTVTPTELYKNY